MNMKSTRWVFVMLLVLGPVATNSMAQGNLSTAGKQLAGASEPQEQQPFTQPLGNTVLYAVPSALDGPVDPETYVLGPSDELSLILRGPDAVVHPLRVLPEGYVLLPNVGPFKASGMTLAQLKMDVREALGRYYKRVEIDLLLTTPRRFVAYVSGDGAGERPADRDQGAGEHGEGR
jgi:protein involved in polysaccharide export with SLBB domain